MSETVPQLSSSGVLGERASWLARALVVSAVLHGAVVATGRWALAPIAEVTVVDIELAPPPPKAERLPEERARKAEPDRAPDKLPASVPAKPPPVRDEPAAVVADAGVDAPIDAPRPRPKKKRRPDAGLDASEPDDAGPLDAGALDAGPLDAAPDDGRAEQPMVVAASGDGGAGDARTVATAGDDAGTGSGSDNLPAVDGAPTTAGTAANLLAYFPNGHLVTALVRFDRLRKTEWAKHAEALFRPMPDYRALFGDREVGMTDRFDTLVVSTPRPKDATATTLVVHTAQSRAQLRDFLDAPDAPIAWSATRAGLLGQRKSRLGPADTRVLLSPWKGWFVLALPGDLGDLGAAAGTLDAIEAKGRLPGWLAGLRAIERESGDPRGPALVVTMTFTRARYKIPDVGLGASSIVLPQRVSLAMELVKQGWLVRGNIVFATEDDAAEFVATVTAIQQRLIDSDVFALLLKRQHAYALVKGFSLTQAGTRVSYGTSMSIADARVVFAIAAQVVGNYFASKTP